MTASSVEFFPCRVQLMGLPRSASTAAATGTAATAAPALQQTPPRRPPMEKVQGVSRNLFGSPEPGEINHLLQQETRRQHSYVFQRYNIDMKVLTSRVTEQQPLRTEQEQPTQQLQLPTLIARELKQHEQRLQQEECNLKRPNEITPPNAKIQQHQTCGGVSKIVRRCCNDEPVTPPSLASAAKSALHGSSMERQKPYTRQSLLTESFNLRKNKMCGSSAAAPATTPLTSLKQRQSLSIDNTTTEIASLETNTTLPDTHRHVQVLQMPQAMQAEMTLIDSISNDNMPTATITDSTPDYHNDDTDDCNSISSSSGESSPTPSGNTTFSLKLVVSAQNSVAARNSAASREHTHHA